MMKYFRNIYLAVFKPSGLDHAIYEARRAERERTRNEIKYCLCFLKGNGIDITKLHHRTSDYLLEGLREVVIPCMSSTSINPLSDEISTNSIVFDRSVYDLTDVYDILALDRFLKGGTKKEKTI